MKLKAQPNGERFLTRHKLYTQTVTCKLNQPMKIFNIITSVILAILILCIVYLIPEFESIQVDPMGDGQSGIGKGVIGLMILGLGILSLIFALIFILLMVIRTTNRNKWSYINLLASFLISAFTFIYFFG